MTLSEIPGDLQQAMMAALRAVRELLEALPQVFGDLWGFVARTARDVVVPILPALSNSQQDTLVTVALVAVGGFAIFLVAGRLLCLVRPRKVATARLRRLHR